MLRSDFTATNIPKAADIRHELLRLRTSLNAKIDVFPVGVHGVWETFDTIRVALGGSALTPPVTPEDKPFFKYLPERQALNRALKFAVGDTTNTNRLALAATDVKIAVREQLSDILLDAGWA